MAVEAVASQLAAHKQPAKAPNVPAGFAAPEGEPALAGAHDESK
jgi:hypothetical protein